MEIVAYIHTDFPDKFGIPRQSGIVSDTQAMITFVPPYDRPESIKGIDGFEYLWLLWQFQGIERNAVPLTVRPPRLGGNVQMGVFATRSPFRPNGIGLSSVRLERVAYADNAPILYVSGADLRDMTPIYDIKPYLPFTDSHPDAAYGYASGVGGYELQVKFPGELLAQIPGEKQNALLQVLRQDPRPAYQNDPSRLYGLSFAGYNIKFTVSEKELFVTQVEPLDG